MCPFGLVPPLVGRAASGRALAPEPPRATRSQTEPIRTAADNGLFLFLQFPFLWFFFSLFFPLVFLQHFSQVFTKSPTTSYFDIPRFPTLACKDCSRVGTGQFEKSGRWQIRVLWVIWGKFGKIVGGPNKTKKRWEGRKRNFSLTVRIRSGWRRVACGSSGATGPPLAACPIGFYFRL